MTSPFSRRPPARPKTASGGLGEYNGYSVFEKPYPTRVHTPFPRKPRWGSALAQTNQGDAKNALVLRDTTTAELWARPTGSDNPKLHAFWVIKGESEWYILTGGKDPDTGKVTGWIDHAKTHDEILKLGWKDAPNETIRKQETKMVGTFQVDAKFGTYNGAAALKDRFNSSVGTRSYNPEGPNSNFFARDMGRRMGAQVNVDRQRADWMRGWNWTP